MTAEEAIAKLQALGHTVIVSIKTDNTGTEVWISDYKCGATWTGKTIDEAFDKARKLLDATHPNNIRGCILKAAKNNWQFESLVDALVLVDKEFGSQTTLLRGDQAFQLRRLCGENPRTGHLKCCYQPLPEGRAKVATRKTFTEPKKHIEDAPAACCHFENRNAWGSCTNCGDPCI